MPVNHSCRSATLLNGGETEGGGEQGGGTVKLVIFLLSSALSLYNSQILLTDALKESTIFSV